MEVAFQQFLDIIIKNKGDVKTLYNKDIMLLKAKSYITDIVMETEGYDFTLLTSTPPASLVGKREYQFHKGSLVALGPGVGILAKHSAPTKEYTSVSIKKNFFQDIAQQATGKREIIFTSLESSYSPQLLGIIQHYENELQNNPACPLMAQSIAVQMVIQLLRDTHNNSSFTFSKLGKAEGHISRAIEYMQTFYNAGISIEDICREINLSPYYFIRLFKTQTGKTPHEYLLGIRLEKAIELIRERMHTIEEIAHICGFVSLGHFSTVFKSKMGVSPSVYRKNA